ncbi:SusC/RagA family TonB-linked outer membrane protein [Neptunitalea lumnitzerae]|uniref:SusC/RagA family TonB-linked outer membrane protein n=1 Tax=Neptunitalea lumnitzerae TaxID=2965509 RepID=A0ABQ5MHD9_9FLAO|nr:SusC/RagA family TonB-linked outer membrane protein [Neptunitalea sp. Y10]GLB48825.1 SusC/RagA family TonB-linked outer membrane protein [Neptunitalea sp. Y10]
MRTKFSGFLTLLLVLIVQLGFAQEKTITGTVVDPDGLPLPGTTVQVKGKSTGTQTDFDGNYSITATEGDVLVFSYIGFKSFEAPVGSSSTVDVTMQMDAEQLGEVVVTGALGIKRKQEELTAAQEVVKAEKLTQAGQPDAVVALTGKVSGLNITTTSSGVNETTRVVLRGGRSISGNNEALVVIDGVISSLNFLKSIDPNSIASVNVIKGANGAALYGSAGSNGVIVVETKKGSNGGEGKLTISVRSNIDFQQVAFLPERQTRYGQGWSSGDGWANYTYENGGWGPEFDGQMATIGLPQADGSYITRPYSSLGYDNIKEFFQTGITTQNQAELAYGDSEGYANLSFQNQQREFVIENDNLKQNTFNFKAGKTLGKWKLSANATYTSKGTDYARSTLYADLLQTASNIPVQAFENSGNEGHWNGYYFNPYWLRDNNRYERRDEYSNFIGEIGYEFNDHIDVILRSNARLASRDILYYQNGYADPQSVVDITGNQRTQNSGFYRDSYNTRYFYTDFLVNFDYQLTDDLNLKANIGANNQYSTGFQTRVGGQNLTVPGIYTTSNLENGVTYGSDAERGMGTFDNQFFSRSYAVYANLDLGYKDFLFLNATARNDWTSVLDQSNNSFFYPSVGLSFVPTKAIEGLQNSDAINFLKVFASYVQVGNASINPYEINATLSQGTGYPFNSNSYILSQSQTDPLLTPEFTDSYEVGLNAGLFHDKVTLDAAYFYTSTTDLITDITPSYASGLSNATVNLAETEVNGFEIDLGLNPFQSSSPDQVDWALNLSFSTNKTNVVSVTDQSNEVLISSSSAPGIYAVVGEEFPVLQGTAYERDPEGHIVVDATTGNPIIASGNKNFGRTTPKYIYGLNSTVSWKNFTLSATMDYRTGHVFWSQTKYALSWSGHLVESAYNRGSFVVPNSVYQDGSGNYVPNTNITAGNSASAYSQYYSTYVGGVDENNVLDASAVKLREISLKYSVPSKLLENTFISDITISANARNLYTWLPKENRGYSDPESANTSGNAVGLAVTGNYPSTRSFGLGLNVIF